MKWTPATTKPPINTLVLVYVHKELYRSDIWNGKDWDYFEDSQIVAWQPIEPYDPQATEPQPPAPAESHGSATQAHVGGAGDFVPGDMKPQQRATLAALLEAIEKRLHASTVAGTSAASELMDGASWHMAEQNWSQCETYLTAAICILESEHGKDDGQGGTKIEDELMSMIVDMLYAAVAIVDTNDSYEEAKP